MRPPRSFPKEEKVQACGAEALALIAVDESETSRLAPEDLVEEGAITVLLTAMKTHRNNASLQARAPMAASRCQHRAASSLASQRDRRRLRSAHQCGSGLSLARAHWDRAEPSASAELCLGCHSGLRRWGACLVDCCMCAGASR